MKENDSIADAHSNIEKMRDKILEKGYYWNSIKNDCRDFIRNCVNCTKVTPNNKKCGICPIITEFPLERIQMDLLELPFEIKECFKPFIYLLNVVYHFSKIAWSFPLKSKSGEKVLDNLKKLLSNLILKPKKFNTDNGGEFKNSEMEGYLKQNNIEFVHGRPSHPQNQGGVERFNNTILKLLGKNLENIKSNNFPELLNELIFIYNNSPHSTTKFTPIESFNLITKPNGYEEKVNLIIENTKKRSNKIALKLNFREGEKIIIKKTDLFYIETF